MKINVELRDLRTSKRVDPTKSHVLWAKGFVEVLVVVEC